MAFTHKPRTTCSTEASIGSNLNFKLPGCFASYCLVVLVRVLINNHYWFPVDFVLWHDLWHYSMLVKAQTFGSELIKYLYQLSLLRLRAYHLVADLCLEAQSLLVFSVRLLWSSSLVIICAFNLNVTGDGEALTKVGMFIVISNPLFLN